MEFDNKEFAMSVDFATSMIADKGKVAPIVIGIDKNGNRRVVLVPWRNDTEKELAINMVCKMFKKLGVVEIVFMTEAWGLEVSNAEFHRQEFKRPSENANRKEMVIINYLSDKEKIAASMPIIREEGKVSVGKLSIVMNNDFQDNVFGRYFSKGDQDDSL